MTSHRYGTKNILTFALFDDILSSRFYNNDNGNDNIRG